MKVFHSFICFQLFGVKILPAYTELYRSAWIHHINMAIPWCIIDAGLKWVFIWIDKFN